MMSWKNFLHRKVKVIKHDVETGLIALDKPIKVLSHPNQSTSINTKFNSKKIEKTIFSLPYHIETERYTIPSQSAIESVHLLNRLDVTTSGIILISTSESTAREVRKLFAERHNIIKKYYAISIVEKNFNYFPLNMDIVWEDNIKVISSTSNVLLVDNDSMKHSRGSTTTKTAITSAKLISVHPFRMKDEKGRPSLYNLALLELRPKTGFTHQLRYQCASHGFPLLGDRVYGNFKLNKLFNKYTSVDVVTMASAGGSRSGSPVVNLYNRLFLHSSSVELSLNASNYSFSAQSDLPSEFTNLLQDVSILNAVKSPLKL